MSRFSQYDEELKINCVDDENVYAVRNNMQKYIPSLIEQDLDNFVVVKSKLLYVGTNEMELKVADELGLGGGDSSDSQATVVEIQAIIDGVVGLGNDFENYDITENTDTENGFIGKKLVERISRTILDNTWDIVIEYDKNNKEVERFDSGYYLLEKGKEYKIQNKEIEFKNDYVVDYQNQTFTVLSNRAINWNISSTLGIYENLALNLDPMSLAKGKWEKNGETTDITNENYYDFKVEDSDGNEMETGIQKTGDVEYNEENKALRFNENKEENPEGKGGLIRLKKEGLNFENGLTFEMYANLSRIKYKVGTYNGVGFFCRGNRETDVGEFMRFGLFESKNVDGDIICKLHDNLGKIKSYQDESGFIYTSGGIATKVLKLNENEDFYLSVVYSVENER